MPEQSRVQVLLDDVRLSTDARQALQRLNADVSICDFTAGEDVEEALPYAARLILTADERTVTNGKLRRLHEWFDRAPCPTLVLSEPSTCSAVSPHAAVANGRAIEFAGLMSKDELAGRLRAMCALHRPMQAIRRELEELKQRDDKLRADLTRLQDEIHSAGTLQRDLLRSNLPIVNGVDIEVVHRPAETLSGDFYDVTRLDDRHIVLFLADATGHGVSAALLTTFVRRWLDERGSEFAAGLSSCPAGMLTDLNRELLSARLRDCYFVASLLAVYDERTRILRWARGGAPYPILARHEQAPLQVKSDGPLVGITDDPYFELVELQLEPGDTILLHTDGLDALLLNEASGLGCSELSRTEWFRTLGTVPLKKHLAALDVRMANRPAVDTLLDDTTILAMHIEEQLNEVHNTGNQQNGRLHPTPVALPV